MWSAIRHRNLARGHGLRLSQRGAGFEGTTNVIIGFYDLILERYGPEAGMHAREAPGVTPLPLGFPVTIAAEVGIDA